MTQSEKTYTVKIPVYTTEIINNPEDIFGGVSYKDMINDIVRKIEKFKDGKPNIESNDKNKTPTTVIESIECSERDIGQTPSILLKIKAYITNLYDGYLETGEKTINIGEDRNNKLGSENNFILLYPIIDGIEKQSYHFLVLVYDDPNKREDESIKIAKLVLKDILKTSFRNLKSHTVLDELRKHKTIPDLSVKYTSIKSGENEVDSEYQEYEVKESGEFKKLKTDKFKNMPFEKVENLVKEDLTDGYQTKEVKAVHGKTEYKIVKTLINEAKGLYKDAAEKSFNSGFEIPEEKLESVYDHRFIIDLLTPIITEYRG